MDLPYISQVLGSAIYYGSDAGDNSHSLHPAWKDEWQEKHEALGKEVVDILNICAALRRRRSWLEPPDAFPEMLDSSLLAGK